MKNKFKFSHFLVLLTLMLSFTACDTLELDLTESPNDLDESLANPNYLLNGVQNNFARNIQDYGRNAMEVTRITNMFGRNYQNAYGPASQDNEWQESYTSVIKNIRLMNAIAEPKGLKHHIAMGQVIEAYTIVNLVDFYGDIPYSEAMNSANLTPKLDSGNSVYTAALDLLNKSITNFGSIVDPSLETNLVDVYYAKNWTKWINLANTIKLKIYVQKRLVDPTVGAKFDAIVASGNYIQTSAGDFQYEYGTNVANPDVRSELYEDNYLPTGTTEYMSNTFINFMLSDKSVLDPRRRFYFYRQVSDTTPFQNGEFLDCAVEPAPAHYIAGGFSYCVPGLGYWGRDHGDANGVPPDAKNKTAYGLYPIGGRFDDSTFKAVTNTSGAKGAGITPILLASTVDFWRAEMSFITGTGDAKALMLAGVQKSFTKVRSFITRDKDANIAVVPALTVDTTYLADLDAKYTASVSNDDKMETIANELFVTLFGNGIDAYNFYRRTGFPKKLQPNLEPNPGAFIRSFFYPANETSANFNVAQKTGVTTRVFWDNNPTTGFPAAN